MLILFLALLILFVPNAIAQVSIGRDFTGIKTIAVLPPRIDVYELGAGHLLEKIDEWSARAIENVTSAVNAELKARSEINAVIVKEEGLSPQQKNELEELNALYDVVRASIRRHVLGLQVEYFEEKQKNFDYSLGRETERLMLPDTDALLVIRGFDQISSAGRHVLNATAVVAAAALGTLYIPQGGRAEVSMALVHAKTGDILWLGATAGGAGTDLREPSSSTWLVNEVFRKFPIGAAHDTRKGSKTLED